MPPKKAKAARKATEGEGHEEESNSEDEFDADDESSGFVFENMHTTRTMCVPSCDAMRKSETLFTVAG